MKPERLLQGLGDQPVIMGQAGLSSAQNVSGAPPGPHLRVSTVMATFTVLTTSPPARFSVQLQAQGTFLPQGLCFVPESQSPAV